MEAHLEYQGKALRLTCLFQAIIHGICLLGTIYFLLNKMFFDFKVNGGYLQFAFGTDYFTLFFFLLISILGLFVSIYSSGYLIKYQNEKHFNVFLIIYNLFAISLYLVVGARDIVSFLLFWELMSLTSYFLVIFEGHKEEILKSGLMYFVMTHIGTVFIMLAFFMLYKNTGSIYFSDFYKYSFDNKTLLTILLLALTGFGTKAGIVPMHVWLPKAYPAAPTSITSLMSGVMINMGIYGIIRFSFEFSSGYILSFGFILLVMGCISAVIGITHGLVQKDIKKFLAYSSIENVGIIIIALGISYICFAFGLNGTGSIAFAAALVHILNHGIFKGMLFMGAGNLLYSTGTTNIEVLGGLIKKMPKTAVFFLAGALSACALPPFNGFIGEWLIYKSIVKAGSEIQNIIYSTPILLSGVVLAFAGALAAYGFVKTFGIAFLGLPRSEKAERAKEVPASMIIPMGGLTFLCLILGVFPSIVMGLMNNISNSINQEGAVVYNSIVIGVSNTGLSIIILSTVAVGITLVTLCFMRYKEKIYKTRIYETWDCGFGGLNSRMQFSGQGFIKSFNKVLSGTFVVNKTVKYSKGHLTSEGIKFDIDISDNLEKSMYNPIQQIVKVIALKVQRLQHGFIQSYLAYVFIALVLLMIFYL